MTGAERASRSTQLQRRGLHFTFTNGIQVILIPRLWGRTCRRCLVCGTGHRSVHCLTKVNSGAVSTLPVFNCADSVLNMTLNFLPGATQSLSWYWLSRQSSYKKRKIKQFTTYRHAVAVVVYQKDHLGRACFYRKASTILKLRRQRNRLAFMACGDS